MTYEYSDPHSKSISTAGNVCTCNCRGLGLSLLETSPGRLLSAGENQTSSVDIYFYIFDNRLYAVITDAADEQTCYAALSVHLML